MRRTEITQTFPVAGTGLLQARVALYPMMIGVRITSRQCRDERRAIVGGWVGLLVSPDSPACPEGCNRYCEGIIDSKGVIRYYNQSATVPTELIRISE